MERKRQWNIVTLVILGLSMVGCGSQARRVDCDWKLKPINPPTSASAAPSTTPQNK